MQKHLIFVIIESPQNNKTKECFCMINYSRLGYEIKRDFTNFYYKNIINKFKRYRCDKSCWATVGFRCRSPSNVCMVTKG